MNTNCEIIRDLLPLYVDGVCSGQSRTAVEEHLADCAECTGLLEKLKKSELESSIAIERNGVIENQARFFRRKSAVAGAIIAGIFALPVLICLIADLAVGAGLSWSFIVFASILVAASLTVVPLVAEKNKGLLTLGAFICSLLLLFLVCCVYTGGRWFFVASLSVLFGLAVVFLPFVARSRTVASVLGSNKGLAVIGTDTALFLLMLLSIAIYNRSMPQFFGAVGYSLPFLFMVWAFFAIIRYLRINGLIKGGICTFLSGAFIFFADFLLSKMFGYPASLPELHLGQWGYYTTDDNIKWLILLCCAVIGAVLIICGIIKERKKNK